MHILMYALNFRLWAISVTHYSNYEPTNHTGEQFQFLHRKESMIIKLLPLSCWQHCRSIARIILWALYNWLYVFGKCQVAFEHAVEQVQSHYCEQNHVNKNETSGIISTLPQGQLVPFYRARSGPFYKALSLLFWTHNVCLCVFWTGNFAASFLYSRALSYSTEHEHLSVTEFVHV